MRKFLCAVGIAATLLSCKKADNEFTGASDTAELAVHILPTGTKSGTEEKISSCDIFVFYKEGRLEGQLETHYKFSEEKEYKLSATAGKREIFAVLNMDEHDFSEICAKKDLLASVSRLEENKDGKLQMAGFETVELKEGSNLLNITVKRFAARVKLNKITRKFSSGALAKQDFIIKEIFLSDAVKLFKLSSDHIPTEEDFVNKLGVPDAQFDNWLRRKPDIALVQNESFDTEQVLYTYPNPFALDTQDGHFTPRSTKLVVSASLGGELCYYVIPLGVLESNRSYEISELTLTRRGGDNSESKTNLSDCEFKVSIKAWTVIDIETEKGKYVI